MKKGFLRVSSILAIVVLAIQFGMIAVNLDFYLYDFRAFYLGAQLFQNGADPYDFESLTEASRALGLSGNNHPFLYHPLMLYVYQPLVWLPFHASALVWLCILCLSLGVIGYISVTLFRAEPMVVLLLIAVGMNGTVAAALRAGQMSIPLTALILLGAVAVARGRHAMAAFLFFAAAFPKLWPAPLIGLLVARLSWRGAIWAAVALGFLVGLLAFGQWLQPENFARFAAVTQGFALSGDAQGAQDGSSQNVFAVFGALLGDGATGQAWLVWVAVVVLFSAVAFFRLARVPEMFALQVSIALLGLALVLPRLMVYQWVVVLPALAWYLSRSGLRPVPVVVLACVFYPGLYVNRYLLGIDLQDVAAPVLMLPAFTPFLACLIVWVGCVAMALRGPPVP